jgi:hypothetical protein
VSASSAGAVYLREGREPIFRDRSVDALDIVRQGVAKLRALVMATFVVLIAALLAAFLHRIISLWLQDGELSLRLAMDAVFVTPFPSVSFRAAVLGAVAAALVFYPRLVRAPGAPSRWAYLSAGLVALTAVDYWLLGLKSAVLLDPAASLRPHLQFLLIQGLGVLLAAMLTSLYRWLAPIAELPSIDPLPLVASLYGWARLALAALLVIIGASLFALHVMAPPVMRMSGGILHLLATTPGLGALAICLAVGTLFYWPPGYRGVTWKLPTARTVIFLASLLTAGLLYRTAAAPDNYLTTLAVAAATAILAIPLQRILS